MPKKFYEFNLNSHLILKILKPKLECFKFHLNALKPANIAI